jgi:hypothetical protein
MLGTNRRPLLFLAMLALVGCGGGVPSSPPPAQIWTDAGYVSQGPYLLSYSAQPVRDLEPAIARRYGLSGGADQVVVTATLTREPGAHAVPAAITVSARTLSGVPREVVPRPLDQRTATTWLGELQVGHRELLVFEITAEPVETPASSTRLNASFQREFFTE